jgi:hypothetical protein
MRRKLPVGFLLLAGFLVPGCPIYPDGGTCHSDDDCGSGYLCDRSLGACYRADGNVGDACEEPTDCGPNETCGEDRVCVSGDCTFSGCVSGFECDVFEGAWQCVSIGDSGGSSGFGGEGPDSGGAPSGATGGVGSGGVSSGGSGGQDGGQSGGAGGMETSGGTSSSGGVSSGGSGSSSGGSSSGGEGGATASGGAGGGN